MSLHHLLAKPLVAAVLALTAVGAAQAADVAAVPADTTSYVALKDVCAADATASACLSDADSWVVALPMALSMDSLLMTADATSADMGVTAVDAAPAANDVPEPGSLALLTAGLGAAAVLRRRRAAR